MKKFSLNVMTLSKKSVELTEFTGCYKAFDEKGNEFDERYIQADLLGTLLDNAIDGAITFTGVDDSVYNAKFVKWSTQCSNLAGNFKSRPY